MNSGELPLKTRRKVSLAPDGAGTASVALAAMEAAAIRRKIRRREVFMVLVTAKRSTRRYDARQPATRCAARSNFVRQSSGTYCGAERARFRRYSLTRQPKPPP